MPSSLHVTAEWAGPRTDHRPLSLPLPSLSPVRPRTCHHGPMVRRIGVMLVWVLATLVATTVALAAVRSVAGHVADEPGSPLFSADELDLGDATTTSAAAPSTSATSSTVVPDDGLVVIPAGPDDAGTTTTTSTTTLTTATATAPPTSTTAPAVSETTTYQMVGGWVPGTITSVSPAVGGQHLLLHAADGQHPALQRDLAGHAHVGAHRRPVSRLTSAVVMVMPADGPSLGTAPGGEVHVEPPVCMIVGRRCRARRVWPARRTGRSGPTPSSRRRAGR
jgi:hypothetical protein